MKTIRGLLKQLMNSEPSPSMEHALTGLEPTTLARGRHRRSLRELRGIFDAEVVLYNKIMSINTITDKTK